MIITIKTACYPSIHNKRTTITRHVTHQPRTKQQPRTTEKKRKQPLDQVALDSKNKTHPNLPPAHSRSLRPRSPTAVHVSQSMSAISSGGAARHPTVKPALDVVSSTVEPALDALQAFPGMFRGEFPPPNLEDQRHGWKLIRWATKTSRKHPESQDQTLLVLCDSGETKCFAPSK